MSIVVDAAPEGVEQVTETQVVEQEVQQEEIQATPTYVPPEKYAGKTLEEVVGMHQNAERVLGKQGQEVGQQRQLIQQLMDQSQASPPTIPTEEPGNFEDTFYEDPAKAVNSAIENHPEIQKAKAANVKAAQQANLSKLETTHPDFQEVVTASAFQEWVGKSTIRTELFRKANSSYDYSAADELIGTWKQLSMVDKTRETNKAEASKRKKAMQQTSSETRSSNASVGGKKMYRRSDLITLQRTDPARYEALGDEIMQAYSEGRVK